MIISIGNVATDPGIRVCRPTPLGNPFPMRCESDRPDVIDKFRQWLNTQIKSDTQARSALFKICAEVRTGRNITLCCYCVAKLRHYIPKGEAIPKGTVLCHADIVAGAALWVIKNDMPKKRQSFDLERRADQALIDQLTFEEALECDDDFLDVRERVTKSVVSLRQKSDLRPSSIAPDCNQALRSLL